jgi:hypothetical protein
MPGLLTLQNSFFQTTFAHGDGGGGGEGGEKSVVDVTVNSKEENS